MKLAELVLAEGDQGGGVMRFSRVSLAILYAAADLAGRSRRM
jgi:hypothetical protein